MCIAVSLCPVHSASRWPLAADRLQSRDSLGPHPKNRRRLGWHLPLWIDPAFLLGCSTSLEALKSLLSTTGHWHDFAHLELQSAWEHFTSINTYPQAVGLLARY